VSQEKWEPHFDQPIIHHTSLIEDRPHGTATREHSQTKRELIIIVIMNNQVSTYFEDLEMQMVDPQETSNSHPQMLDGSAPPSSTQVDAGGGTVTDSEFQHDSSEHTTSEANLLMVHRKGIIGLMERTPLPIKLIVMCLVSIVGMMLFVILTLIHEGTTTYRAIVHRDTIRFMNHVDKYIIAMQDERLNAAVYLSTNETDVHFEDARLKLKEAIDTTRKAKVRVYRERSNLYENLGSSDSKKIDPFFSELGQQEGLTDQHRRDIESRKTTSEKNFSFYRMTINYALLLQTKVMDVSDLGYKGTIYLFVARLIESIEKMNVDNIELLLGMNLGVERFFTWLSYRTEFETYQTLFLSSLGKHNLNEYFMEQTIVANPLANYNLTEQNTFIEYLFIINNGSALYNFTEVKLYSDTLTNLTSALRVVERSIVDSMLDSAWNEGRNSISSTIVFCVIAFVFAVLSVITAVVLSGTIIAPWRRMNRIQELAIAKFVPQGFLHMIGCKRITDVKLGMHIKKDKLTLMEVELLDFEAVSQQMNDEELFNLLNQYLTFVGPLIRKYGGYIQSYQGEKFTALFKGAEKAVKASLEMQETINMFNEDQPYVNIRIGTRIHSDSALIGTLGENERIDGAVLSPSHSHIKTALTRLTNKLQARTLTTKNVVSACNKNAKRYQLRKIGSVSSFKASSSDKNQDSMEVYELLHPEDTGKLAQKESFDNALELFLHGRYGDSVKVFEKVCHDSSERDGVAEAYLQKALDLQKQTKLIGQSLQMGDILQDDELRVSFEQFCIAERSQENISIWNKIQEYRTIVDSSDRIRFAKDLYDKYLSLDGLYTVNINESMKKEVMDKIQQNESVALDHTLFDRVKKELELLMSTDTLSRYKSSDRFQVDVNKSAIGIKTPLLDEM